MKAERIELEPVGDGTRWRVKAEGGDVEGHTAKDTGWKIEPAGEQSGEPVYRVSAAGEDVEGHARHFRL
jgi:hypothetical protein